MQERRCRGQAAARLRAAGGLLELRGDRLAGPRRGCGQMPRATIGSMLWSVASARARWTSRRCSLVAVR
jgi:hypothetical protein